MLARTPNGNLLSVYRAVIEQAENFINHLVETQKPADAEISESGADWYLVHTVPGEDLKAMRWLARRRFGVFRPMQQCRDRRNDARLIQGWEPVFPGWLFVFCWDVMKMKSRIESCPGVMKMLCDPVTKRPIAIDQVDDEGNSFVDKLRALNWVYDENAPFRSHTSARAGRHTKRMKPRCRKMDKRTRMTLKRLKNALKAKGKWEPSTWQDANGLAPPERIALMLRTLNAPPCEVGY